MKERADLWIAAFPSYADVATRPIPSETYCETSVCQLWCFCEIVRFIEASHLRRSKSRRASIERAIVDLKPHSIGGNFQQNFPASVFRLTPPARFANGFALAPIKGGWRRSLDRRTAAPAFIAKNCNSDSEYRTAATSAMVRRSSGGGP